MKNQSLKKVLGYAGTIHGLQKETKRAWAEYFEMERKMIRQKFLLRLYGVLLLGFMIGLVIERIGF